MTAETDTPTPRSSRNKLWLFSCAAAYFAACFGAIYLLTGRIVGAEFMGLLWGTLGGFIAAAVYFAAIGAAVKKLGTTPERRGYLKAAQAAAAIALAAALAFTFLGPLVRRNPADYRYGGQDSRYTVTYGSGRTEARSGADLGADAWGWDVGLYFALAAVIGGFSLYELSYAVRELLAIKRQR